MKTNYAFRIFFDWGSSGGCLWPLNDDARGKFGFAPSIEEFPASEELKPKVHAVEQWYQTALNWD